MPSDLTTSTGSATERVRPRRRTEAQERKLERLDIPDDCYVVKASFYTRPGDDVIDEIKRHVKDTGLPHTWRGHTHTKPDRSASPIYLEEFDLPERLIKAKRFAPCPCCWPESPKYGKDGKIAWFEIEGVIRLLGPDCFAALNPEGHEKAKHQLHVERNRKKSIKFLLSNLPQLPPALKVLEKAITVAKALETFHTELHRKLLVSNLILWPYVRTGDLKVLHKTEEFRQDVDTEMRIQEIDEERVYAPLRGHKMLDPELKNPLSRLQTARSNLQPYRHSNDWAGVVARMDDNQKFKAARTISRNLTNATAAIAELEEVRQFVEPVAINTLRNWGLHDGCPIPRNYSHKGDNILFGRSEYDNIGVPIPRDLRASIGTIDFSFGSEKFD